jgi:hypothetical protein
MAKPAHVIMSPFLGVTQLRTKYYTNYRIQNGNRIPLSLSFSNFFPLKV